MELYAQQVPDLSQVAPYTGGFGTPSLALISLKAPTVPNRLVAEEMQAAGAALASACTARTGRVRRALPTSSLWTMATPSSEDLVQAGLTI